MPQASPFIIWGSRGHAKVLVDVIEQAGGTVIALVDNDAHALPALAGVPLLLGRSGLEAWQQLRAAAPCAAALAIGGARGADRCEIGAYLQAIGYVLPTLCHATAAVSPSARLGDGSQVLANAVVAAAAVVGDFCIVNNSANVDHECVLHEGVHIGPGAVLCGEVEVGAHAFVGAAAVVLPRVRIGRGARIGAGAVVNRPVPDCAVVVGNPARVVRVGG